MKLLILRFYPMRKESLNTINFSLMAYVVIRLGHGISAAIEQFQNHKKITGPLFQGVLSGFSHVQFFVTLRTVACQAPFSMGFSRKEYQSGLPCPPPGDLPNPGIKPESVRSSALPDRFFTTSATQGRPSGIEGSPVVPDLKS